jgi:hypothetical protein
LARLAVDAERLSDVELARVEELASLGDLRELVGGALRTLSAEQREGRAAFDRVQGAPGKSHGPARPERMWQDDADARNSRRPDRGVRQRSRPRRARGRAEAPQTGRLRDPGAVDHPDLCLHENLRFFAGVLGAHPSRVDEIIETVSLGPHADRVTSEL